ncbi:MAG: MBL fold metallo-hydrolase [Clostridiales bacterium]|nr:MBL fold metallo-hydrolase [Clostridiales bacterium]
MITEEVAKNIYKIPITLPNNPLRNLNSYLIKDPQVSLLIDTGFRMEECLNDLLAGLAELEEDPAGVDIFVTHLHADHTGNAMEIVGEDRQVMISAVDRGWMTGEDAALARWTRNVATYLMAGMELEDRSFLPGLSPHRHQAPQLTREYVPIENGHVFHVGGHDIQCILTPGHTPGHMCLWEESNGIMFTGDHVLFDITPNITVWGTLDDALGAFLDSLDDMRKYPVKQSLPAHRNPGDFHQRIDELFAHHERRLDEILGIVSENPGFTGYDISSRMKWRIRAASWEDFPYSQKIFAVGECMSHLDYLQRRDKLRVEKDGDLNHYFIL